MRLAALLDGTCHRANGGHALTDFIVQFAGDLPALFFEAALQGLVERLILFQPGIAGEARFEFVDHPVVALGEPVQLGDAVVWQAHVEAAVGGPFERGFERHQRTQRAVDGMTHRQPEHDQQGQGPAGDLYQIVPRVGGCAGGIRNQCQAQPVHIEDGRLEAGHQQRSEPPRRIATELVGGTRRAITQLSFRIADLQRIGAHAADRGELLGEHRGVATCPGLVRQHPHPLFGDAGRRGDLLLDRVTGGDPPPRSGEQQDQRCRAGHQQADAVVESMDHLAEHLASPAMADAG